MSKIIFIFSLFLSLLEAQTMFQSVSKDKAEILQDGKDKYYCPNCGMNLPMFYKTNHAARLSNGKVRQYCSLYCLVEQFEITDLKGELDKAKEILVVDVNSLKFIDAKKAFYVVGSNVKGTMSMISKYAFASEDKAKEFISKNGGEIMSFEKAYKIALNDFAKDTALVYSMRDSKMYDIGKKLYETKCDKEKLNKLHAHTMGEMKVMIKNYNICGENLDDKPLQAIMLYFWDIKLNNFEKLYGKNEKIQEEVKKLNLQKKEMTKKGETIYKNLCSHIKVEDLTDIDILIENDKTCSNLKPKDKKALNAFLTSNAKMKNNITIEVPKEAKCPVCGMFVYKYPKWVAVIEIKNSEKHYFDGVKDMMKFVFNPEKYGHNHSSKDISNIYVTNYYTSQVIEAKNAFFVIGSDIYGPMGHELIPFSTNEEANEFLKNHHGKKILTFDSITKEIIDSL